MRRVKSVLMTVAATGALAGGGAAIANAATSTGTTTAAPTTTAHSGRPAQAPAGQPANRSHHCPNM